MKKMITRMSAKPAPLLLLVLALTALFLWAIASRGALVTNLDEYMPSGHPAFVFSDQAEEIFGIEDAVLFALEHPESIYNKGTLEKIAQMTEALSEQFEQIEAGRVTSLYTAENITSSEWGLEVEPFYWYPPETEQELSDLRAAVEANEMINSRIVSADGKSTLIIAEIASEAFTDSFYGELLDFARSWEGPEKVHLAGRPVIEGELANLGPADMKRMAPLVVVLMVLLLYLLLGSGRATAINMIIVLFGTLAAFGSKALLGIPMYAVDTMIPVMLIAIGVAYGIHMHNSIYLFSLADPDISRADLVSRTLQAMIRPVSMAAITTAVGFSALMTSQVLPVRYFGLFASLGVLVEMVLALLLFPASVFLFGPPKKRAFWRFGFRKNASRPAEPRESAGVEQEAARISIGNGGGFAGRVSRGVLGKPKVVLLIALGVLGLSLAGTGLVWIDTSFLANFEEDSAIAVTDRFVNDNFGGTSSLNVIFTAQEDERFKEPAVLKAMDALQQKVMQDPAVGTSFGLTDYLRRMHKVMHQEDPAYDAIPESREMIAQYLLLYEMSGDPDNLNKVVDYDYGQANLTFQLKSDSSAVMEGIIDTLEESRESLAALGIDMQYAGSGYKALVFADLLLSGQLLSLFLSFFVVALLLTLMFKNLLIGLAGTVPIALTGAVNFGTMGLLGIPLSSATALISSIAVGIGVDYAIHLIEHYRTLRRDGVSIDEAARGTMAHTGRAIVFNALAVMGGFAVLLFSVFPPNRQVGALIALNMASSAVGTLTLLLVLITFLDKKGKL